MSDLSYAPLCRETIDETIGDKNALLEIAALIGQIDRLLAKHPGIEEVSTQQLTEDVNRQIAPRVRAIAEYCDPPRDEAEYNWPRNVNGARF